MGKNIVFAWELGGGYGHIAGFLPLARQLTQRGHRITWVLRDLANTHFFALPRGNSLLQAPIWKARAGAGRPVANYAQLLGRQGYLQPESLLGLVQGWRQLFTLLQPDLILFDHSPTALLASHGDAVPRALLGTGFFTPPPVNPLPSIRPWEKVPEQPLIEADRNILGNINQIRTALHKPELHNLFELFETDENFLCTLPELDHYPVRNSAPYWGPRLESSTGAQPAWPAGEGYRIFGYLKKQAAVSRTLLQAFNAMTNPVLLHIRGWDPAEYPVSLNPNIRVTPQRVHMDLVGNQADCVVCHAGHGTVSGALLRGRRVILAPTQQEQRLLSYHLQQQGLGLVVPPNQSPGECAKAIGRLMSGPMFKQRVTEFAQKYADFNAEDQVQRMANRCEELMGD